MLTASEANNIANKLNDMSNQQELQTVIKDIETHANKGKFNLVYENKPLYTSTTSKLKELGYIIKYGQKYNDEYIEIQWR